ncbi:MAG TPA: helix-turn-helix transcriptional regulator [Candidatus Baltobacteraceae bacterium]
MIQTVGASIDRIDDSLISIVKRRAKPRVILLDSTLAIAFAEADAMAFLAAFSQFPTKQITHLPPVLETAVRKVVECWTVTGDLREQVLAPLPQILLRVSHLGGPSGSFVAVFLEDHLRREDLASVGRRFALTRREVQVLTLILNGLNAAEIALRLSIAETTVSDYFKSLMRKTNAKNRADMLAKALGWDGSGENAKALDRTN